MRLKLFLMGLLAVAACCGGYLELAARCRCERGSRFERRAARQERRAIRRGYSTQSYTPATPSYVDPYQPGVQPLGATRPEYRWECDGRSCRLVLVTPQAADCPPATEPKTTPEPEPPQAQTEEAPAVEPLGKATTEMTADEAQRWFEAETAWRPDPPVIPPGYTSVIPQLDE